MRVAPRLVSLSCEVSDSDVRVLGGPSSKVNTYAWSLTGSLLAFGSLDSTTQIWDISIDSSNSRMHVLDHSDARKEKEGEGVTALAWNEEGELLATGSYEGHVNIWSKNGESKAMLDKHTGPVSSLQWNKRGDLLLTGSYDKTAILWYTSSWECKRRFTLHSASLTSVAFRNHTAFATCSKDKMIYICNMGRSNRRAKFAGHKGTINAIQWDPTALLLASCSDDRSIKIWSVKPKKCLHTLQGHDQAVNTIKWSPTGPGTSNPDKQLLLASASDDSTIKLWDAQKGHLLRTLSGHRDSVYDIAFSPNGDYLASGSVDQKLHIWSVNEGNILKTYSAISASIFHVSWNKGGNKVIVGFANGLIAVINN